MATISWLREGGIFNVYYDRQKLPGTYTINSMVGKTLGRLSNKGYTLGISPPLEQQSSIDVSYNNINGAVFTVINGITYELSDVTGGGTRRGRKMKRRTMKTVRTMRTVRKMKKMN